MMGVKRFFIESGRVSQDLTRAQLHQQLLITNGPQLGSSPPYMQLLYNNTFYHLSPLFNKTTYQCVGPLPGHPRNMFVWLYVCIQKLVYAYKRMRGQAFFL